MLTTDQSTGTVLGVVGGGVVSVRVLVQGVVYDEVALGCLEVGDRQWCRWRGRLVVDVVFYDDML